MTSKTLPKTHWRKLYNPNYLGSYSLEEGKDMILTIKDVTLENVTGSDGKTDECTVVKWVENVKPMILNKTNASAISKVMGSPYIEDWKGKSIQLYVTQIKAFGEIVDALRVRPFSPKTEKEVLSPSHKSWEKAKEAISQGNITVDKIRRKYTLSEENYLLLKNLGDGVEVA